MTGKISDATQITAPLPGNVSIPVAKPGSSAAWRVLAEDLSTVTPAVQVVTLSGVGPTTIDASAGVRIGIVTSGDAGTDVVRLAPWPVDRDNVNRGCEVYIKTQTDPADKVAIFDDGGNHFYCGPLRYNDNVNLYSAPYLANTTDAVVFDWGSGSSGQKWLMNAQRSSVSGRDYFGYTNNGGIVIQPRRNNVAGDPGYVTHLGTNNQVGDGGAITISGGTAQNAIDATVVGGPGIFVGGDAVAGFGGNCTIGGGHGNAGDGHLFAQNLPTTDPHHAGAWWCDASNVTIPGVIRVSAG